jgi:hypothetical protein
MHTFCVGELPIDAFVENQWKDMRSWYAIVGGRRRGGESGYEERGVRAGGCVVGGRVSGGWCGWVGGCVGGWVGGWVDGCGVCWWVGGWMCCCEAEVAVVAVAVVAAVVVVVAVVVLVAVAGFVGLWVCLGLCGLCGFVSGGVCGCVISVAMHLPHPQPKPYEFISCGWRIFPKSHIKL